MAPCLLTAEAHKTICDAVADGQTREVAAALAGVHVVTLYRWMAQGKKQESGPLREFYDAVKRSEAVAHKKSVDLVRRAARKHWQAAAWWLERRYRHIYALDAKEVRELTKEIAEVRELLRERRRANAGDRSADGGRGSEGGGGG